jgi:uncharacterized membrane protein YedE/YeeE
MKRFFFFGLLFGFILSKSGATSHTAIAEMFLFHDLHLMFVIGVAILAAGVGFATMRRLGASSYNGDKLQLSIKPRSSGNWWGGLLFGAGWALTGSCPGTALAQLGEGKFVALFTLLGIFLGTEIYRRQNLPKHN